MSISPWTLSTTTSWRGPWAGRRPTDTGSAAHLGTSVRSAASGITDGLDPACITYAYILQRSCQIIALVLNKYCPHLAEETHACEELFRYAHGVLTQDRGIYSIGAVGRMLGLSPPAIRSWEDRYGLIVAERSEGGRRLYTRDQLEQLRFVKERVDEGLSAADAHRLLAERQAGTQPIVDRGTLNTPAGVLVLLADSDRYGAQLNDSFLRSEGYEVEIALTAEDAEEKFAARDPALSIVELMISGGVGRSLCQRLKQSRRAPVLCISSLDLREQALAAGADAFLKKPLEPLQLAATVKDLIGHSGLMPKEAGAADE
jgi:DNA-binding transcriptional MerR regulator